MADLLFVTCFLSMFFSAQSPQPHRREEGYDGESLRRLFSKTLNSSLQVRKTQSPGEGLIGVRE